MGRQTLEYPSEFRCSGRGVARVASRGSDFRADPAQVRALAAGRAYALRNAFEEVAGGNGVIIFSELMDAASLFLTAIARSTVSRRST